MSAAAHGPGDGFDPSDDEAEVLLSIMFADRVGNAARILRAYGDRRVRDAAQDARKAPPKEGERR